jgi:hypothetical protein
LFYLPCFTLAKYIQQNRISYLARMNGDSKPSNGFLGAIPLQGAAVDELLKAKGNSGTGVSKVTR